VKKYYALICVMAVAVAVASAGAQETQKTAPAQVDETSLVITDTGTADAAAGNAGGNESLSTFSAWDFIKMILVLICVVAAIYGLFRILRKMSGQKYPQNSVMQVVSGLTLPGKKGIYIVRVGKEFYTVGTAENSINLLSHIEDKETIDEIILKQTEAPVVKQSFMDVFSRMLLRRGDTAGLKGAEPELFMKEQRNRLKRL